MLILSFIFLVVLLLLFSLHILIASHLQQFCLYKGSLNLNNRNADEILCIWIFSCTLVLLNYMALFAKCHQCISSFPVFPLLISYRKGVCVICPSFNSFFSVPFFSSMSLWYTSYLHAFVTWERYNWREESKSYD